MIPRDESIISMGEFERKLEGNYEFPIDGPLASPTPGPALAPSESMSTLNSTGGGYKYKTHLLSRYSSQLEEENRILKELLRNALKSEPIVIIVN